MDGSMFTTHKSYTAVAALVFLVISTLSSCNAPEKRYDMKGRVVSVDKKGRTVTVSHEKIEGYMDGMTMAFRVKDDWPLDVLQPGDNLTATLVISGSRSWLEGIVSNRTEATLGATSVSSAEPSPGSPVPDVTLINQDGKKIKLSKLKGQTLVVTFIYTRCPLPDYCPLMTQYFSEVYKAVAAQPANYPATRLISITVDPRFDTPAVLREYALANSGAGKEVFARWDFATSSTEDLKRIAGYFGLEYFEESDQIIHSLKTGIISPDGTLAKLYRGSDWKPSDLVSDLATLKTGAPIVATSQQIHQGVGVVEGIDREVGTIQINHEEIKGFMPAMSMPFPVDNPSLLDKAQQGDRITFTLKTGEKGLVVTELKKE